MLELGFCNENLKQVCNLKGSFKVSEVLNDRAAIVRLLDNNGFEKPVEIHPLIDYHPTLGFVIGTVIGSKPEKLILLGDQPILTQKSELELEKPQRMKIRLKPLRNLDDPSGFLFAMAVVIREALEKPRMSKEDRSLLFQKLVEKITHYWFHTDPRWYTLVACWIIGTHCYTLFSYFPILHLQGERESGKTTFQEFVRRLVRNPTARNVAMREAPLFRTIEDNRPTFFADVSKLSDRPDIIDICEACTEKGGVVKRCIKDSNLVLSFQVFTPVCLATRLETEFEAKCIRVITSKPNPTTLKIYALRRREIEADAELDELRKAILLSVIHSWREIKDEYDRVEQTDKLYGRLFDYWRPFLAICKVYAPDKYGELLTLAEDYALTNNVVDLIAEIESEVLHYLADSQAARFYLKDLTDYVAGRFPHQKVTWQRVRSALSNLGVVSKYARTKDGLVVYVDRAKVEERAKLYFASEEQPATQKLDNVKTTHEKYRILGEPLPGGTCELCGKVGADVVVELTDGSRKIYAHKSCLG
jgi:hypothetical protein